MKFSLKSFTAGAIIATIGVTSVFASGIIKSAEFNQNKVVFNGKEIDMSADPMLSVVKEGETSFSNYMPLRALLEAMGYTVTWSGETKTVFIDTKATADEQEDISQMANMPNPWETVTEEDAFKYLGAKFDIKPPEEYTLSGVATLSEPFTKETTKTARFAYTNDNGEMFRVHIHKDAAEEVVNQGELVNTNGTDAYYDMEQSSVAYAQGDYMVVIDMAGKSEDELLKTVGAVTLLP